jgi:hypothetical protein
MELTNAMARFIGGFLLIKGCKDKAQKFVWSLYLRTP